MTRPCNGCTACCEGWLVGQARNYPFYPGRPCHFKQERSCAIYPEHPDSPCKDFLCLWAIQDELLPEWMRPDLCGAIAVIRTTQGITYVGLHEAGRKLDSSVLIWFVNAQHQGIFENLRIMVGNGITLLGSQAFKDSLLGKVIEAPKKIIPIVEIKDAETES